jgi:hypothetical protein
MLHEKHTIFLSGFKQILNVSIDFLKSPLYKMTKIRPLGEAPILMADGETGGRTDMTELLGAIRYLCFHS